MDFTAHPKTVRIGSKARDAMPENVTSELILEHLTKIQGKLSQHDERFSRLEGQLRAIKSHVAGLVQSDLSRDADQAFMLARVDRIERRLGLVDTSVK